MGLLSGLKKKAQKSAKAAYKAKVADDKKRKKNRAAAANVEEVKKRQKSQPKKESPKKTGGSYFQSQAKQQRAVANVQKNKKSWAQMAQEANEKRKAENRNALGTRVRTRTIQSNNQVSNPLTKAIYESGTRIKDATSVASGSIANTQKGIADYEKKTGYKFSDEEKKQITKDQLKEDLKVLKDKNYNKQVKKAAQDYADQKTGKKWKVKSEDMTSEDYQKMQNALRMGGGADTANKAVGDDLAKKIGSRTAYAADRSGISRFSHGALQGLAPVDVEKGIGIYGDDEKQALKEPKESKAGMAGYMAGFAGSMALGGTSGMGKAIAKGVGKGAAKATTKSTAKKFMQNRAGELVAETPLNVADAAKMSMDENGKVDKKQMLKYLGLNTAMTGGMGGAIEGIGIKFTKKNADEYVKLLRKEAKEGLSEAEQTRKLKLKSKLDTIRQDTQAARSNSAAKGYNEGQTIQNAMDDARFAKDVDDVITGKNNSGKKLEVGDTPDVIREQGASNARMSMKQATVKKIAYPEGYRDALRGLNRGTLKKQSTGHNLGVGAVKSIRKDLEDPMYIFKSDTQGNSFVVVTHRVDKHGNPVIVALHLDKNGRYGIDNEIASEYAKKGDFINEQIKKGNLLFDGTKKGSVNGLQGTRLQLPERDDPLDPMISVQQNKVPVKDSDARGTAASDATTDELKIKKHQPADAQAFQPETGSLRNSSSTDDASSVEKISQRANTVKAEPRDVNNPDAKTKSEVSKALEGSKKHQEYVEKPRAEQIKEQRPTFNELKKQVDDGEMSGYETSKHLESIYDAGHFEPQEIKTQLEKDLKAGSYIKVNRESHADAIARAEKSVDDDWKKAYDRQIAKSEAEDLTAYDYAERKFVMEKLEDMVRNGEGDVDELVKLHRDMSINEVLTASNTGAALNAAKIMKRMTPAGRAQLMLKKVEKLNAKFGDRLKGEKLELTDEQYNRILKAESEEDAAKVLDQISEEIMERIPSTVFEKLNEIRRFTMLANIRTHERNIIGNSVFAGARYLSDALEVAAYKIPAVRNRVEKLGGITEMNKLSYRKMIKENREFLDDQFKKVYEGSGSQTQYKDVLQTGQPKAFKSDRINKILDANYTALEKEDMLMFKPTFRKAYARWCDSRGIKDMSKMTEQQMEQAGKYALYKAEHATFRDDSTFARKICGYKTKSAGKKGKTALGTVGYRAANMAIEGHLPFVKTPVNILRRSIDYSPLGIAKGISKLAKVESAEAFKDGIHEICSGMTGTGVAVFGALLASQGVVTTQAGKASGDAYYDRDMGYQDYSLVVGAGDHKYSLSIDWASPMQTALFMGSAMYDKLDEDGFSMQDIMDIGVKVFNPMLDMSFMSTSKDTFDSFMDKVYRNGTGDNADWTGAITQTLFGKVPQGYLGSLVPQMISQAATGSDKFQRDTRSTNEDAVAASWESWGRQLANKIPVLRQNVNNPKVDRFGKDKKNTGGDNIVMRYVNSMLNPSNMKRITTNDMDRELISIFNKIPEGTQQKNYFFYDFTGNPDYELANGKRMTYNELYTYGKTKRQSQSDSIQGMFDAGSYKNMSNDMKVDEIVKYKKDISTIQADMKVYGSGYTLEKIVGGENVPTDKRTGGKADSTAWRILESMSGDGEETKRSFVNFWITKENLMARAHDTGYETKALACALTGNKELGRAYDVNRDKIDRAFAYLKEKGKKVGYKLYSDASCNIMAGLDKAQVESTSRPNRSWSAAGYNDIDEPTYRVMGFDWNSAQSGAGLRQKYKYDVNQLLQMASDAKYEFDEDQNGSLKKSEVMAYIDSLGIDDKQHKACLFEYLAGGGSKNPYDSINDYLKWGEESRDDEGGYGRGRRRGRRHGRRGFGGGGGGRGGGGNDDWYKFVDDMFNEPNKKSKVKDNTKDSLLNEAYRRRMRKQQMVNKKS